MQRLAVEQLGLRRARVAVGHVGRRAGRRIDHHASGSPAGLLRLERHAPGDTEDPRRDPGVGRKLSDAPEAADERLLRGVQGERRVAEQIGKEAMHPRGQRR